MKNLLLVLSILFSTQIFAELDYRATTVLRTYALAGGILGQVGYGQKFWDNGGPLFGYIRPSLNAATSGSSHKAGYQLDFYPISFLGTYAGATYSSRSGDYQAIDCKILECEKNAEREYLGAKAGFKKSGAFFTLDARKTKTTIRGGRALDFGDEQSRTIGRQGHDWLTKIEGVVGVDLTKEFRLGFFYTYYKMKFTQSETNQAMVFGSLKNGIWSYNAGAGIFRTQNKSVHPSILLSIRWNGKKGIPLF